MRGSVLLTGSEGFTGKFVRQALEDRGWKVLRFGMGSSISHPDDYHVCDLTDAPSVYDLVCSLKPTVVIHLAAVSFIEHDDPTSFYNVNLLGTRNLLTALEKTKKRPECVLIASSANVYGSNIGGVLGENTPPNPSNEYAVSKIAMEYLAHLWMNKLPITITRPFNYTGVGQSDNFLIPKIVHHFKHRSNYIELGNTDISRDFSDVRDIANIYAFFAEKKPIGETINLCSGTTHTISDILNFCKRITGHEIEIRINPKYVREKEIKHLQGDRTKLKALIGGENPTPLYETLSWMLNAP